jgi:hypothetical protein
MMGLYLHFPIHLHGGASKELSTGTSTFTHPPFFKGGPLFHHSKKRFPLFEEIEFRNYVRFCIIFIIKGSSLELKRLKQLLTLLYYGNYIKQWSSVGET